MWENRKETMGLSKLSSKVHEAPVMQGALLQSPPQERTLQMWSLQDEILPQP